MNQDIHCFVNVILADQFELLIRQTESTYQEGVREEDRFLSEFLYFQTFQNQRKEEHCHLPEFMTFV